MILERYNASARVKGAAGPPGAICNFSDGLVLSVFGILGVEGMVPGIQGLVSGVEGIRCRKLEQQNNVRNENKGLCFLTLSQ